MHAKCLRLTATAAGLQIPWSPTLPRARYYVLALAAHRVKWRAAKNLAGGSARCFGLACTGERRSRSMRCRTYPQTAAERGDGEWGGRVEVGWIGRVKEQKRNRRQFKEGSGSVEAVEG